MRLRGWAGRTVIIRIGVLRLRMVTPLVGGDSKTKWPHVHDSNVQPLAS
jgi:hypothetical protein